MHLAIVSPLRAATYQTLIGLLAASGLWIGEAIKLDRSDLDWAQGVLLIRESKFGNYAEGVVMPSLVTGLVAGGNSAQDSSAGQSKIENGQCRDRRERVRVSLPTAGRCEPAHSPATRKAVSAMSRWMRRFPVTGVPAGSSGKKARRGRLHRVRR